jgi:hypothetical protein
MKIFTLALAVEVRFTFTWEMSQRDLETEPVRGTDLPATSHVCIKQIQLVECLFNQSAGHAANPLSRMGFGNNLICFCFIFVGRDSAVGIATRYGLDGLGIDPPVGSRFSEPVQTGPGTHTASYKMGTESLSQG